LIDDDIYEPVEIVQVTLQELLLDPIYSKWFDRRPTPRRGSRGWRVYVQREPGGKWLKRDFRKWKPAHQFLMAHLSDWHDASLSDRVWAHRPPVVRDPDRPNRRRYYRPVLKIINHRWCEYCRRPTVFRVLSRHHNIGKCSAEPRCTICGIREVAMRSYT
jgi:hypothetical protein